ncbi:hypothetical protein ACEZ3G_02325 [Maribacter algicola]|uniref:Uncharacterized protein n=1 Tax=Meishania litoralis TaxID=3434685 RepID=A0ACC7LFB3_9FLAO
MKKIRIILGLFVAGLAMSFTTRVINVDEFSEVALIELETIIEANNEPWCYVICQPDLFYDCVPLGPGPVCSFAKPR